MSSFNFNESFLYRHRYILGYGLMSICLLSILIFAGLFLPGAISNTETQSAIISGNISLTDLNSWSIVNLPYHLIQKLSFIIFGVSNFSIKLPSIMFAFLSAVGIIFLLRRWFKPTIGILASLIAISTSQFIFFAQDGTPGIMYIFWAVWLMLLASLVIRRNKYRLFYIAAFYITAALSLYTPLSIYAMAALVISIILHPHLRFLIKNMPKPKVALGIFLGIILVSPLIVFSINSPRLGLDLLGVPSTWPNLIENIKVLGSQYFGFYRPGGAVLMTPFFELGSMMIVSIGLVQVIAERYTSKNYMIIFWIICLIPILLINPSYTSVTFLPIVLLLASGINMLLSHWYSLFPKNPYARVAGLVPTIILVSVLVFSGLDRHIFGYSYNPNLVNSFSKDLDISKDMGILVVSQHEYSFYSTVAKYNNNISVSTSPNTEHFWTTRKAKQNYPGYQIDKIVTSANTYNSDRFYLYKKSAK